MGNAERYFRYLVDEIHTTIMATIDSEGLPVTAATDMMDTDGESLFFLEGSGEWFDLSKKPIERASFTFGGNVNDDESKKGYSITDRCIGCGSCVSVCPQSCILTDSIPFTIEQQHCLHCGNCMNACPAGAVERR